MFYTDGIHLVADTLEELHKVAKEIGLRQKDFIDNRHQYYPLIGNFINKAILAGAQFKDTRDLVNLKLQADLRKNTMVVVG